MGSNLIAAASSGEKRVVTSPLSTRSKPSAPAIPGVTHSVSHSGICPLRLCTLTVILEIICGGVNGCSETFRRASGWWAPNPRALRRKSDVAPCSFCPKCLLGQKEERHLQSIFTLSIPAWPWLGTLCRPPRLVEGSSRGRERPSPNSLQCWSTGHPLPRPMVVSSQAPSFPPP